MLPPMSAVGLRVVMYFSLLWRCCGTLSSLYGRGHCLHKDDDSYNMIYVAIVYYLITEIGGRIVEYNSCSKKVAGS